MVWTTTSLWLWSVVVVVEQRWESHYFVHAADRAVALAVVLPDALATPKTPHMASAVAAAADTTAHSDYTCTRLAT